MPLLRLLQRFLQFQLNDASASSWKVPPANFRGHAESVDNPNCFARALAIIIYAINNPARICDGGSHRISWGDAHTLRVA